MKIFEYHTEEIKVESGAFKKPTLKDGTFDNRLKELGRKGWELVNVVQLDRNGWTTIVTLIFKREKEGS